MFCPNCGSKVPDGAPFCPTCGTRVAPAVQQEAPQQQAFQPQPQPMQQPYQQPYAQPTYAEPQRTAVPPQFSQANAFNTAPVKGVLPEGKDKTVTILLCFFLGSLGIHNFYLGENKKGLLRLLTTIFGCGIGGIFALIDFIKLLVGSYTWDPNALI